MFTSSGAMIFSFCVPAYALLDDIIARGDVAECGACIEARVLVSGGDNSSSVGYYCSIVTAGISCYGVIIALYRAGGNLYRVLTVVEHIVFREYVCVSSGVHTVRDLILENVVVHMDVSLTCQGTAGLTVLPVVVVVGYVILE